MVPEQMFKWRFEGSQISGSGIRHCVGPWASTTVTIGCCSYRHQFHPFFLPFSLMMLIYIQSSSRHIVLWGRLFLSQALGWVLVGLSQSCGPHFSRQCLLRLGYNPEQEIRCSLGVFQEKSVAFKIRHCCSLNFVL